MRRRKPPPRRHVGDVLRKGRSGAFAQHRNMARLASRPGSREVAGEPLQVGRLLKEDSGRTPIRPERRRDDRMTGPAERRARHMRRFHRGQAGVMEHWHRKRVAVWTVNLSFAIHLETAALGRRSAELVGRNLMANRAGDALCAGVEVDQSHATVLPK